MRRDNAQRRFRVVVPASCIGTPKRVSVGLGAIAIKGQRYFVDDAFSSRATDNLARSRWIRRG